MAFVPCSTGTVALYQGDDGDTVVAVPVEAWDDAGVPYVAGATTLVSAHAQPSFIRLEQAVAELPRPGRKVHQPERLGPRPRAEREPDVPHERGRP